MPAFRASPRRLFPWLLLAAGLFYAALLPRRYVGFFNDDAQFVLLARSLLEGRYSMLWVPGQPPETLLMPGFPLLLAPFVWLWAPHWAWLKLIPLAFTLLTGFLFGKLSADRQDPWLGPALLALFLFNPVVADLSGSVMADVCLLCAALFVFHLLQRACAGEDLPLWGFGLLLGWAAVVRPIAVLLLPASAVALFWARGWRAAARALVLALAAWGAVLARNQLVAGEVTRYAGFWREGLPFLAAGPFALLDNWHRVAFLFCGPALTGLRLPREGWGLPASAALIAGVVALLLAGFLSSWRDRDLRPWLAAAAIFCAGCLSVQAFWPYLDTRYYLPLIPFGLFFLARGVRSLCRRLPRPGAWLAGCFLLVFLSYAAQDVRMLAETWSGPRPAVLVFPGETLEWAVRDTPENGLLLTKAPLFCLYAGRKGLVALAADDIEEFRYNCLRRGVTHIVSVPFSIMAVPGGRILDQARDWSVNMGWAASWPEAFAPVYANAREGTAAYRVVDDAAFRDAYALFLAAREALAGGELAAGLGALDRAVRLRPRLVSALNARGAALMLSGDPRGARRSLRQALAVRPDHALALANLARLEARQGRKNEARRFYARARRALERTGEFRSLGPVLAAEEAGL